MLLFSATHTILRLHKSRSRRGVFQQPVKLLGPNPRWLELRRRIAAEIHRRGRDPRAGHLLQHFDASSGDTVDAALLQLSALGLPFDLQTFRATRLAVQRHLGEGDFLHRYAREDGVPGSDGAFLVCSFWLADSLLAEGDAPGATRLFERLLDCANDVGLYSEEIDPASRAFLGNFPQAFTHLGLVNTAVSFELFRRQGIAAVRGGYADRARRSVGASIGWRGALAALRGGGKLRLVSSRASRLDPADFV